MLQKKICLLGGPAVGKTSLVARLVRNFFTERHLATIGVRIDKWIIEIQGQDALFVIWDLAGADEFRGAAVSYLRGAAGYLVTIDGMRKSTLVEAVHLQEQAHRILGPLPFVAVLNKADMEREWEIGTDDVSDLAAKGWLTHKASAKTGFGVLEAFRGLAEQVLARQTISQPYIS